MTDKCLFRIYRFRSSGCGGTVGGGEHRHDFEGVLEIDDLAFPFEEFDDLDDEHLIERHTVGDLEHDLFFAVVADDAAVAVGAVGEFDDAPAPVAVDDMADIPLAVGGDAHAERAASHYALEHFKGVHAVPDDRRARRRTADRPPDHRGLRPDALRDAFDEIHVEPERGGREEAHVVFLRDPQDFLCIVECVRERLVQKDRLAQFRAFRKIFQMFCRIIDLNHDRVAVGYGGIEILGHQNADALQIRLALVESLLVLERGFKAETPCRDKIVNLILFRNGGILHQFREFHRMAGVESHDRDLDSVFHFKHPSFCLF